MAFAPDDLRAAIAKAREQLSEAKNLASDANKILRERDQEVSTAKNVAKYQVPDGADAVKMLDLTFGNDVRGLSKQMSADDLRRYAQNVANAQEKFKGGITPQQIIDRSNVLVGDSTQTDLNRANREIFFANVFSRKADTFRYVTNASAHSKDDKHYVIVQFLGYSGQVTGTDKISAHLVKKYVTESKIRFTCDCGRHKFWFNYLAGLGNYQIGAKENRMPFIKNPNFVGVACKHVVRVMKTITSPTGVEYIRGQINKDRLASKTNLTQAVNRSELQRNIAEQAKKAQGKRAVIVPSDQTNAAKRKLLNRAIKAQKEQAAKVDQANADVARLKRLEQSLRAGLITQEDYDYFSRAKK